MKPIVRTALTSLLVLFGASYGGAQQTAAPADGDQSLATTMSFLQQQLSSIQKLKFSTHMHDSSEGRDATFPYEWEISKVQADAATCQISYHIHVVQAKQVTLNRDFVLPLKSAINVVVRPVDEVLKEIDSAQGDNSTWIYDSTPKAVVVKVRLPDGSRDFDFLDHALADRVAKAMSHAMALCGG